MPFSPEDLGVDGTPTDLTEMSSMTEFAANDGSSANEVGQVSVAQMNAEELDLTALSDDELAEYEQLLQDLHELNSYDWFVRAHSQKQLLPITEKDWATMFFRAGRGFGKTETGAQWVRWLCENFSGLVIGVVAPTKKDLRETIARAILQSFPPESRPRFNQSNQRIDRLPNDNLIVLYSEENGELIRGANLHFLWLDEVGSWGPRAMETYINARLALRLGANPQCLITSTPKPTEFCKMLCEDKSLRLVTASTFENPHLSPQAIEFYKQQFEGTRIGRQELYGELLTDTAGALWTAQLIEGALTKELTCELVHCVVAIDPAVTSHARSDETGIVVAGLGEDGFFYLLEDASGTMTPGQWAARAVELFETWQADAIVAEVNNGGDLVVANLRAAAPLVKVESVTASRGKQKRAEPVVSLYEQGKVKHLPGLTELEKQQTTWVPTDRTAKSPDRLDAAVWALAALVKRMRKRAQVF